MGTKTHESHAWVGVRTVRNPLSRKPDLRLLYAATNGRCLDAQSGGGFLARPGFARPTSVSNGGNASQGVYCHQALDGTNYNFLFVNGKVWRYSTDLSSAPTDVTPTNIIQGTGKFVYATSLDDEMIVNDGVNKPWRATSLGSTPIVATVIEQQTPANVLSRGSTDTNLANTAFSFTYRAGGSLGTQATQAANAVGTAFGSLGADGTIPANLWGAIRVELNSSAAFVFTPATGNDTGYATEALAIAGLPARTATYWSVGYLTVRADAGAVWIAGTDALAGGTTGNQAQTTNYYAGEGPAYSVFGQPVVHYGALFWIYQQIDVATVPTYARTTIGWSEPNEPGVGYQQTDYDNQWTVTQTSQDRLYALAPTNGVLYYFRQLSIGAIAGAPGVNFQGTATHDLVSGNVGCVSPKTVAVVLNTVYFCDSNGLPWRFRAGAAPDPIWKQAVQSTTSPSSVPSGVATDAWAVVEPNLNLYIVASWPQATISGGSFVYGGPPTYARAFDAITGVYMGDWSIAGSLVIEVGGIVRDANNCPALCILQGNAAGTAYVWRLYREWENVWLDNAALPTIDVTASPLPYFGAQTVRGKEMRVLHGYDNSGTGGIPNVSASVTTPAQSAVALTARAAQDTTATETGRTVFALDVVVTRGLGFTVTPATATNQWKVWGVEVDVEEEGHATVLDY